MLRLVGISLKDVPSIPLPLRADPAKDFPLAAFNADLGKLFLHHYHDCYPAAPPDPDPTSFEYLHLVSGAADFRFHAHVASTSSVKKRHLSTEIGQAFCRLILQEYFGATFFAHMGDVVDKPAHAAFDGMTVERSQPGDVPDYLCTSSHDRPFVGEAKGRFSKISFASTSFTKWRQQFDRIRILGRDNRPKRLKGYIVATQFGTDKLERPTHSFVEDPVTPGEDDIGEDAAILSRGITAIHYGRLFLKLQLQLLGSALLNGFALAGDVSLQTTVWTCLAPPFVDREFVGGLYRTAEGPVPTLSADGWRAPIELGGGHLAFWGVERNIAVQVAAGARGDWNSLYDLPALSPDRVTAFGSEVTWLRDGSILAPATYFRPTGAQTL